MTTHGLDLLEVFKLTQVVPIFCLSLAPPFTIVSPRSLFVFRRSFVRSVVRVFVPSSYLLSFLCINIPLLLRERTLLRRRGNWPRVHSFRLPCMPTLLAMLQKASG